MLEVAPSENAEELPASFRLTLFAGPTVKLPEKPPTLFEFAKLAVTASEADESVEFTAKLVAVIAPVPVSLITKAEAAPS